MALLKRFVADENGATAIEYGLIAPALHLRSSPLLTTSVVR